MASLHCFLLCISFLFFLIFPFSYSITIQQACKATQYPQLCQTSLHNNLPTNTATSLIKATISLSSSHLRNAQSMSATILRAFPHHRNRSLASRTCLDVLSMSSYRLRIALQSIQVRTIEWVGADSNGVVMTAGGPKQGLQSFNDGSVKSGSGEGMTAGPEQSRDSGNIKLKDARAWASAALTYQYDCWNELSYVNGTRLVDQTMSFIDSTLMPTTSNALSLMHALDNYGDDVAKWGPPKTERNGVWERAGSNSGSSGLGGLRFMEGFKKPGKANAVVCKGGKARGCYATVQEAVDKAPAWLKGKDRFVIYIKEGVYEEIVGVPLEKTNLVFLGDGMGKTVITGSVNTGIMGISTYNTATVGVKGDGFLASGITFQNTAGPNAHQAVAFRSDSDLSLIENCEFLGNQDTLYTHSLRQVYRSCHIEGNIDFIFGNAAALFQDCTILVRPRQINPDKGENNAVTAQGRTDSSEATGLVFLGCLINGTDEYMKLWRENPKVHKNYLGRPWKMYSRTVFIGCTLGELISPEGWMPFREDFALSTLYYGEFGNKGPGADLSKRVNWSSRIPEQHVSAYSARNFIQENEWNSVP